MVWWVLDAPAKAVGIRFGVSWRPWMLNCGWSWTCFELCPTPCRRSPACGLMWAGAAVVLGLIMLYTGFQCAMDGILLPGRPANSNQGELK